MSTVNFTDVTVVRLDVSIWVARAPLSKNDLPARIKLPPDELATLGSKRLLDKEKLQIFYTLREQARRLLARNGLPFIGAFAIKNELMTETLERLKSIKGEFDRSVERFLSTYDTDVRTWAARYPQWEAMLLEAIPSASEVRRKFGFRWQAFTVATPNINDSSITEAADELVSTSLAELAQTAASLLDNTNNKDTWSVKTKPTFDLLVSKAENSSFVHPGMSWLSAFLADVSRALYDEKRCKDAAFVAMVKNLFAMLSNAKLLSVMAEDAATGTTAEDKLNVLLSLLGTTPEPQEEAPVPAPSTVVTPPSNAAFDLLF